MHSPALVAIQFLALLFFVTAGVSAQSWTRLAHQPNFSPSTMLLLTDGTVLVQQASSGNWWRLTPANNSGSPDYVNGTWSSQPSTMPPNYAPLYYASAVLPDGRVIVEGGEYNNSTNGQTSEVTLGAIFDPIASTWHSVEPPLGWTQIGDAPSIVLPNGTFMLGSCCSTQQAQLDSTELTWTNLSNTNKLDSNSEEGWTLLPSGDVLTVDTEPPSSSPLNSEIFNATTNAWSSAGSTQVQLTSNGGQFIVSEIGPAILRPDGNVFQVGATSNTAIYNANARSWSSQPGPIFPNNLDTADGPAAILRNGNVLVMASPFQIKPSSFFQFDGTNLIPAATLPNQANDAAFYGRMLVLPTGEVMFTDGSFDIEVYGASTPNSAWAPVINSASFPATVMAGGASYAISGTQFNGVSQGTAYGDDAQAATNYPLVRISNGTDFVFARTHNHSTMGVATGATTVSTQFDVPPNTPLGANLLVVIANGIPSQPISVNVVSGPISVSLVPNFNITGIYWNGSTFSSTGGLDGHGYAYSENLLGSMVSWNHVAFYLGPAAAADAMKPTGNAIDMPGNFSSLRLLATAVNGNQTSQVLKVTYSDGTTAQYSQNFSDWLHPQGYSGETKVVTMAYRDKNDGTRQTTATYLYGYSFALNNSKTVQSITFPNNSNLRILSMTMVP